MDNKSESVTLGVINGVYGVRGWVKVYSYTDPIENILNYKTWQLTQSNQSFNVEILKGKRHGKGIVVLIGGYDDRNKSEKLLKAEISVPLTLLPELPADEFYWRDLEGLNVVNVEGKSYGKVSYVMPTVANDVLVIKDAGTDAAEATERLIPFIQGVYVLEVDLEKGLIQVDWPEDF